MDGRVQLPVIEWLRANLDVDYVDMVTEPGPDRLLTEGLPPAVESIRNRVLISVNVHKSGTVALVAHDDCAGNPVSKDEHLRMVRKGMETVRSWNLLVRVIGLWVSDRWEVEVVESDR